MMERLSLRERLRISRLPEEERRKRACNGHAPGDAGWRGSLGGARMGHVFRDSYVRRCLDCFLEIPLRDAVDDEHDSKELTEKAHEMGMDTKFGELVMGMGEGDKRPVADALFFLQELIMFDQKWKPCYGIKHRFLELPLVEVFNVVCKLPETGDGKIDRMDFERAYDEWMAEMVKGEPNTMTIKRFFEIIQCRIFSFHDDMALGAPWEDKSGTEDDGGIYYDDKEKDESTAATAVWLLLLCIPIRYMKTKEQGLIK